jgi:hypothetical protein
MYYRFNLIQFRTLTFNRYRPCKRCKPEDETYEEPSERAVAKACALIEDALKEGNQKPFRLQDLAKSVGLTPRYFHKVFKDKTGLTPKEYAKKKSLERDTVTGAVPIGHGEVHTDFGATAFEDFDFNALVDFDVDPSLVPSDVITPPTSTPDISTPELPLIAALAPRVEGCTQSMTWTDNSNLWAQVPEPSTNLDMNGVDNGAFSVPVTGELQPFMMIAPSVTSFEAAWDFFLSGNPMPAISAGPIVDDGNRVFSNSDYQDFTWGDA